MAFLKKCATGFNSKVILMNINRRAHSKTLDSEYWQRSIIPTMHFQPSLPRLPIPKLELTCERYLAAQKPLLIQEAFCKTEANVERFRDITGKHLQELLKEKDNKNKHTSYICEPWFDMYLKDRTPLPINYNPMLVFKNDVKSEYNSQLLRSTNMLISSLRFYKSLNSDILEPEVYHMNPKKSDNDTFKFICSKVPSNFSWYMAYLYKAYPLDMSQYHKLFCTTRIPEIDKDRIYSNKTAKHICVQSKGHFYTFDVFDDMGNILPADEILGNMQHILNNNENEAKYPIGILTTLERNTWASLRHTLAKLGNEKELKAIDTALFNICLDDNTVGDNPYNLTRNFLHGDGRNRWFDKSVSLQFAKDGVAAINFEHSWGDGVAVLRYFQDIFKDSTRSPKVNPTTIPNKVRVGNIQKLDFTLNDKLKTSILDACESYKSTCQSLAINFIEIEGIGKTLCKKHSVSPDAIMQLSFQSAYYKQYGKFVASYESCSTAAFKHGRTETIRPCTTATKAYSEAVNSLQKSSLKELKNLIDECSKVHGQLTREAAMGQGFDRHLFALRQLCGPKDNTNIFDDPAYANINYNIISTSTLSSPAVWAGGFGPVVKDGFGIGYVIKDDSLGVLVTSYPPHRDGTGFISSLRATFDEILHVFHTLRT